jgi:methionine-S-sulfoxide reductase
VVRTRVGYSGGEKQDPTYRSIGDHSETIQIDYDSTRASYNELLDVFWKSHNPRRRSWSRQYMTAVFYHNEDQKRLALETRDREGKKRGIKIRTKILPFSEFYLAEDYHQKYYLRHQPELMRELNAIYPKIEDFVASTAVTRVNGYVGRYGTCAALQEELDSLGLSPAGRNKLLGIVC